MERITLKEIAEAVNGQILHKDLEIYIDKISTNSKNAGESTLFIAIKGERFDGHDFIDEFIQNGGKAVMSQHIISAENVILVDDTRLALGALAHYYRKKFNLPIVGITGSVGKTSTRRMIDSVLSAAGPTCSTQGNLNNDIGLPLTLLEIERIHKFAVIEMGMNHLGEISYLSNITKPNVAVITNIGTAHIGNLGSREGILKAKLEILEGLSSDGLVLLNGDDELLFGLKGTIPFRTIYYGIDNTQCDFVASKVELGALQSRFCIDNKPENQFVISAPGKHHVYNALAAIAIGFEFNIPLSKIQMGIQSFEPVNLRQNIVEIGGIRIIEDCYNANPESMKAALEVLSSSDRTGRKIALLGNMLELGEFTESAHQLVGDYVAENKIDLLVTVGNYARDTAKQARHNGVDAVSFDDNREAINFMTNTIKKQDTILIKASRGEKFEEISGKIKEFLIK